MQSLYVCPIKQQLFRDHHLQCRDGLWWIFLVFGTAGHVDDIKWYCLQTDNVQAARKKRDRIIADIQSYLSTHQTTT